MDRFSTIKSALRYGITPDMRHGPLDECLKTAFDQMELIVPKSGVTVVPMVAKEALKSGLECYLFKGFNLYNQEPRFIPIWDFLKKSNCPNGYIGLVHRGSKPHFISSNSLLFTEKQQ